MTIALVIVGIIALSFLAACGAGTFINRANRKRVCSVCSWAWEDHNIKLYCRLYPKQTWMCPTLKGE